MILALLQEPVLPNLEKYGPMGAVAAILLFGLVLLWKKLNVREEMLLQMSNHHSEELVKLTVSTNAVLSQLSAAIDKQSEATNQLRTSIETLIKLPR